MSFPTSNSTAIIPRGVLYMLISALGFALMSATVKYVSEYGIPVFEIVAARALVSFILSYLDVKRKGLSVWGNNRPLLFARGMVGTLALFCVYYAVTTLPLAEATILQYVHPLFTAIIAYIFLKESIQASTIMSISLSVLGVAVMVYPSWDSSVAADLPLFSVGVALLGALGSSIAYVIVRKLSRTEDPSVIIFYFPLVALPVSLLAIGDEFVMPSAWITFMLVLVGIFTQVGQLGLTKAMQTEAAGKASAYSYVQIVFSALLGWLLFSELPTLWTILGGGLIVSGALVNLFWKNRN
jgi:drug/metabolite transporter (DMT)-like permease